MPDFYAPQLDPLHPQKHLQELETPFGKRSVYDSVAYCTRCGCCQQSCPIFLHAQQETFSPRGRNQLLRLLIERKLKVEKDSSLIPQIIASCTLCGRCTQACAGKIPTPEHVLEMARAYRLKRLPLLLQAILQTREKSPRLFAFLVRTGLFWRRLGLFKLLRTFWITKIPSLTWLNYTDDILPKKIIPLAKLLKTNFTQPETSDCSLIYLPSLEAAFFLPELAIQTLKAVQKKGEKPLLWQNFSCGLFSYVYGNLSCSKSQVRKLILKHKNIQGGTLPLLTDSIDVYNFLKKAPQLFAGHPAWEEKARNFAEKICFVTDFLTGNDLKETFSGPVRLETSALFSRENDAFQASKQILKTLFHKNFVECLYTDADMPAFGYAFARPKEASQLGMQAVRTIARTQAKTVFTLSGLSALELSFYLRKFYPNAQAEHIVRLNG